MIGVVGDVDGAGRDHGGRVEGRSKSEVARDYGVSAGGCRTWSRGIGSRVRRRSSRGRGARAATRSDGRARRGRDRGAAQGADRSWASTPAPRPSPATCATPRPAVPSVATIWRVLSRRGFVTPQPHKRPRSSWRRFQAELPNERWQADITHWPLADGREVEILNIIDDHSRLLVASTARPRLQGRRRGRRPSTTAIDRYGDPASMLTDNGAIFTAGPGHGRVALEPSCRPRHRLQALPALPPPDLRQGRTVPPDPQEVAGPPRPRRRPSPALQAQLHGFRVYYNTVRPHRAIARRTPAHSLHRPHQGQPATPGPPCRPAHRVRRDRIDTGGKVTLRYNCRLLHLGIGRRSPAPASYSHRATSTSTSSPTTAN